MNNSRSSEVTKKKTSSVRVLTIGPLIVLVLSVLCALWLITPTKVALLTLISRSASPELSLSFLTILLGREPDNRYVKLLMAKNIYQMGDILKVINFVEPLLNDADNNKDWSAHTLYLEAVIAGAYASDVSLNAYSNQKVDLLFKQINGIPDAKIARKFADVALSFNMPVQALNILIPHIDSHETSYDELVSLALQVSDYDSALKLLSASIGLTYDESDVITNEWANASVYKNSVRDKLVRLHQIYRWQSNTVKAFEISLLLKAHAPSEQVLRDGIAEAKALSDIHHEGLFYNELATGNQLELVEYAAWLNALEKSQGSDITISSVKRLHQKNPRNRRLIIELARLYSYSSEHSQIIRLYHQLKLFGPLDISETRRFSNAYIMLNQPQHALTVLTAPKNWLDADDEYVQMVANLAWDFSQKTLALASLDELMKRSDKHINVYRYIRLHRPFTEHDLLKLVQLYTQTADKTLLLEAISVAYQSISQTSTDEVMRSDVDFRALLDLALKNKAMKDRADVYYYRAMYAIHQHKYHDAHRFFRLSLNSEQLFVPTINGYIWWAIEIQDINTMRELYDTYSVALKDNAALGLTFATLSQQLNNPKHANGWYQKYLMANDKTDITDITPLIHYASLLTDLKLYEQADQLRFYIAKNRASLLAQLPDEDVFLHSLVGLIAGDGAATTLAAKQVLTQPSANSVSQFFQYQLMAANTDAIQFWYQRTSLSDYAQPKMQLLAIAKNNQDPALHEKVMAGSRSSWIPTSKYQDGISQTGALFSNQQINAEFYPRLMDSRSAWRTQYIANTTWDINTAQLDYYQLSEFGDWQLSNYYQTAGSSGVFAEDQMDDEFRLKGLARYQFNRSEWLFGIDIADGLGEQRLGFNVNYSNQFNRNWRLDLGAGLNNDIRASQALALAGSDDVVKASFLYQQNYHTSIEFKVNYHQLSTRFDDEIGDGWSSSLRVSEQLFFNSPAWQIYADYSMHEVNLNSAPLLGIANWHQGMNPLTSRDFISPRYQQLSLGQRFYQGAIGISEQLKQFNDVSQPRFWFDSAVGYNFVTSQPTLLLNLGFGWPILGNDELYFDVDWQSQDRNGEEASKVSVGYFYSF